MYMRLNYIIKYIYILLNQKTCVYITGKCGRYYELLNIASDEGSLIVQHDNKGLEECQRICDGAKAHCKSIGYCPAGSGSCYYYRKQIKKDEKQKVNADCFTSYRICGNVLFIFI